MLIDLLRRTFGQPAAQFAHGLTPHPPSSIPFPAPYAEALNTPPFLNEPIPVWPPPRVGVPAAPPQTLLECKQDLIESIRGALSMRQADFDRLVQPVLERFAAYVHLLPASETDHHSGQGGLLTHSLEVAFYSAKSSRGRCFGDHLVPEDRPSDPTRVSLVHRKNRHHFLLKR